MHLFRNDNNKSKSRTSRVLSVALSAALALGSFSALAMADTGSIAPASIDNAAKKLPETVTSGDFGPNDKLHWDFDEGTLTITGTGAIPDYTTPVDTPWNGVRTNITNVVVSNGITKIGKKAFFYCQSLETVSIGKDCTNISDSAFQNCGSLAEVSISTKLSLILGEDAFCNCTNMKIYTSASQVKVVDYCFEGCSNIDIYLTGLNENGTKLEIINDDPDIYYNGLTFHLNTIEEKAKYESIYVDELYYGKFTVTRSVNVEVALEWTGSMCFLVFQLPKSSVGDVEYGGYRVVLDGKDLSSSYDTATGRFECYCAAKDMTRLVSLYVKLNDPDGDMVLDCQFTVADYLKHIIADENNDPKTISIAQSMLTYGAAAQEYFGEDVNNLATGEDHDALVASLDGVDCGSETYNGSELDFALGLLHSDYAGITMRFGTKLDFYMFFMVKDGHTSDQAISELFENYGLEGTDKVQKNEYVVLHGEASVNDLSSVLFSFSINGKPYSISAYDYIRKVQASDSSSELKILCKALYALGATVKGEA